MSRQAVSRWAGLQVWAWLAAGGGFDVTLRTERDVSAWSSQRLRQLLMAVRVDGPEGVCQLTDVAKVDGDASINNRRGKLLFFYDWQIKANWLGE